LWRSQNAFAQIPDSRPGARGRNSGLRDDGDLHRPGGVQHGHRRALLHANQLQHGNLQQWDGLHRRLRGRLQRPTSQPQWGPIRVQQLREYLSQRRTDELRHLRVRSRTAKQHLRPERGKRRVQLRQRKLLKHTPFRVIHPDVLRRYHRRSHYELLDRRQDYRQLRDQLGGAAAPEAATLLTIGSGLILFGVLRRRRPRTHTAARRGAVSTMSTGSVRALASVLPANTTSASAPCCVSAR